jgi:dipeptidyl aminopeptidase/acylaminoacyl peptidase
MFDLLTEAESSDRENVFNVPLLAARVLDSIEWARTEAKLASLPIGLFGASTGAAAALVAAATNPRAVAAIVSRGGRPDLAGRSLPLVEAPTLLVVGGEDTEVLTLNRWAKRQMHCEVALHIVPGATHLFEEPGALETVVEEAMRWFDRHLLAHGIEWARPREP